MPTYPALAKNWEEASRIIGRPLKPTFDEETFVVDKRVHVILDDVYLHQCSICINLRNNETICLTECAISQLKDIEPLLDELLQFREQTRKRVRWKGNYIPAVYSAKEKREAKEAEKRRRKSRRAPRRRHNRKSVHYRDRKK